jgi:hypothetical protein
MGPLSSDHEIIVTPTAASEDVVSEFKQTQQGSRDVLVRRDVNNKLHVRNAALGGVARCTCKAAAVFDCNIRCMSAWSEATALPGCEWKHAAESGGGPS